jgi:hypothetical protein
VGVSLQEVADNPAALELEAGTADETICMLQFIQDDGGGGASLREVADDPELVPLLAGAANTLVANTMEAKMRREWSMSC